MKENLRHAAEERTFKGALFRALTPLALLAFSVANGFLALRLAACSYALLWHPAIWRSYFEHPPIVLLNVLPPVLLALLGLFLTKRAWAAYLISAVPTLVTSLVNYYKIQLRGDPFLASDFRLIRTAGGILGHYSLDVSRVVLVAVGGAGLMFLVALFVLPDTSLGRKPRAAGALVCLALVPLLYTRVYMDGALYSQTTNLDVLANRWSQVEVFVSRGFFYPFIRSVSKAFPKPPEGYNAREAEAFLAQYPDADISPEKKVNVVGVMLEAFADLSDYPVLDAQSAVHELYEPLHELEAECVHGDLLTNIFAGGTVDSEWGFLTGYSHHSEFRGDVDSYVRYFSAQGYDAVYRHPGYGWFYNRQNINAYLGFDESVFTDGGFGALVDPEAAPKRSDAVLFDWLLRDLDARGADDKPLFSFSVSYQNHGPYDDADHPVGALTQEGTGWSLSTVSILNNYLDGIADTISELRRFIDALEACGKPVVLVVYGDHKPWLGNDSSVYRELGVSFDLETRDGFYNYYATPYLIYANSAAKAILGGDFAGEGGDFSPCFLMAKLFDLCGYDGPRFMALSRAMRAYTPLVHEEGFYLAGGAIAGALPPEAEEFYRQYRRAEYWRETKGLRGGAS